MVLIIKVDINIKLLKFIMIKLNKVLWKYKKIVNFMQNNMQII